VIQPPAPVLSPKSREQFCPEPLPSCSGPGAAVTEDTPPRKMSGELLKLLGVAKLRYRLDMEDAKVARSATIGEFVVLETVRVGGDVEL